MSSTAPSTVEWFGCATFRLRSAGRVIMLDAYIDRVAGAAGPGARTEDITECDWIVVGHSHFDHLYGAERILAATNAKLIGSYESVRVMELAGMPRNRLIAVAGGETIDLGDGVLVRVYPSQHSCVWSHSQMHGADEVCIGDLGVTWQERQERMSALMTYLKGLGQPALEHLAASSVGNSERGDGGALVFVFDLPDGRLLYQDTSGHWEGIFGMLRPDTAILAAAGRGNIDGEPIQGSLADFVARQVELLSAGRVILCHHDDWLPGFSVATDVGPIRAELAERAPDSVLLEPGYLEAIALF